MLLYTKNGYKPFFNVQGGDVAAGAAYKNATNNCIQNTTTPAIVKGQNTGMTGGYAGAGAQLAVLALGQITTFPSGQGGVAGAPANGNGSAPTALTFANTIDRNVTAGQYGGGYGLSGWCLPDYNGNVDTTVTGVKTAGPIDFTTSGTYNITSATPFVIGSDIGAAANTTLSHGVKIVVKVSGDVYLNSNIDYDYGSNTLADLPQFQLLVKGNIYIGNTVSVLHGFYDAQPTATSLTGATTKGELYTCAPLAVPTSNYAVCNSNLTVIGAVSAAHINLERTTGNIGDGSGAAESFIYSPELWLAGLAPSTTTSGVGAWSSITSLPPVL